MGDNRQPDFFQTEEQQDLFGPAEMPDLTPNPDDVRQELLKILAEAKAADTVPWQPRKLRFYKTVFPQMSNWLPQDEAAQLCFEFEAELARLEAA